MEDFLDHDPKASLDPLDRAARIVCVRDALGACADELDALGLWQAGAHLSLAISAIPEN
jgi:hypothetical protein